MDRISVSQLNLYRACGLKYKFTYIDKLPKPFKSSGLAFGAAVHSAIEWLHKKRIEGKEASLEEFLRIFSIDWYSQKVDTNIHYKNGETDDELKEKAKALLTLYFNERPKEITGSEIPFNVPIVDLSTGEVLDVSLMGFIDLVENQETLTEIKTTASALDIENLDTQFQLLTYHYVFEILFRREPKGLKIINLVKTKKPKIEIRETKQPKRNHQWFFHTVKESVRGIQENLFFPNPSFRCKECEYSIQCQEWEGNY